MYVACYLPHLLLSDEAFCWKTRQSFNYVTLVCAGAHGRHAARRYGRDGIHFITGAAKDVEAWPRRSAHGGYGSDAGYAGIWDPDPQPVAFSMPVLSTKILCARLEYLHLLILIYSLNFV